MRRTTAFVGLLALSSCSDDAAPPAATVVALPGSRTNRLPNLDGPVDVATDARGWAHVRASTLRDAWEGVTGRWGDGWMRVRPWRR